MELSIHDEGTFLSIRAVAELAGRNRSTIRKWVRKGKIEAVDTEDGLLIPIDELVRLNLLPADLGVVSYRSEEDDTPAEAQLKSRIGELEVQLAEARRRESELLKRLAQAQDNMGLMLRALPPAPEDKPAEPPAAKKSWFDRMFGLD